VTPADVSALAGKSLNEVLEAHGMSRTERHDGPTRYAVWRDGSLFCSGDSVDVWAALQAAGLYPKEEA
jgi:hypothetical protein